MMRISTKNTTNLRDEFGLFQRPDTVITRRRFAVLAGLVSFMTHTVHIDPRRLFSLLRACTRVVSLSAADFGDVEWGEPISLALTVLADLSQVVDRRASASRVLLHPLLPRGRTNDDYDTVIVVDASVAGWTAVESTRSGVTEI